MKSEKCACYFNFTLRFHTKLICNEYIYSDSCEEYSKYQQRLFTSLVFYEKAY